MVTVGDVQVHIEEAGSGPPVLMLHGNPDSSEVWKPLMERLSGRWRCIAPDLPGFARTRTPPTFDFRLENCASFINGLLDALRITEPVRLLIHDVGAVYGLAFAC